MATTDTGVQDEQRGGPPAAVIEELLSAPRRRALLEWLHERDGAVPIDDLASKLAAENNETVTTSDRRAARTEIYQDHLPRLTATGVVQFDSLLGQVELADVPAVTERLE